VPPDSGRSLVDGVGAAGQDHVDVVKLGERGRQLAGGLPAVDVQGNLDDPRLSGIPGPADDRRPAVSAETSSIAKPRSVAVWRNCRTMPRRPG
jgi:hypothetical protein